MAQWSWTSDEPGSDRSAGRRRARGACGPLGQVWGMLVLALGVGIGGHYRGADGAGHYKNRADLSPARLLCAGASVEWTDRFGPAAPDAFRPAVLLAGDGERGEGPAAEPVALPDIRGEMRRAAEREWTALTPDLRKRLNALPAGAGAERRAVLCWSGSPTGNAALLAHPDAVAPPHLPPEMRPDLVIGNGSWSGDGEIGWMESGAAADAGPVVICLIGRVGEVSAAQQAALGELLNYLEARRGHLAWEVPGFPQPGNETSLAGGPTGG